jgi:hypothetical protein
MTNPQALAGIVKPLEWDQRHGQHSWFADADTGIYRVVAPNGGSYWMWYRYSNWPQSGVILGCDGLTFQSAFPTREAAQAAAQADYAARILAAIDTDRIAALVEAATKARMVLAEHEPYPHPIWHKLRDALDALAAMKGQSDD